MVCRHHQQYRVSAVGHRCLGGNGQGGRGVTALGLQHHGAGLAHHAQLLSNHKAVFFVAHHHGGGQFHAGNAFHAPHRGLQERVVANQGQQLFGVFFTGKGPQARARAAGENDRLDQHKWFGSVKNLSVWPA